MVCPTDWQEHAVQYSDVLNCIDVTSGCNCFGTILILAHQALKSKPWFWINSYSILKNDTFYIQEVWQFTSKFIYIISCNHAIWGGGVIIYQQLITNPLLCYTSVFTCICWSVLVHYMLYRIRSGEVTRWHIAVDVESEVDTFLWKTLDTHSEHHVPDTELA